MPVKVTGIRVDGMEALRETLMTLPLAFREKVVRAALAEAAHLTKVAVEAYAPVYTGLLQQSIRVGKRNNKGDPDTVTYVVFVYGVKRTTGKRDKNLKEDNPYYWYFLEFGTSKMAAHPFMLPAFEASAAQALHAARAVAVLKTEREMKRIARLKK